MSKQLEDLTVTMLEARELVKTYWEADIVPILWGPPGMGKSALFAQLSEEVKMPLIDVRAAMTNPVDHMGFPYLEDGFARTTPPFYWPKTDVPHIILFDEVNSAPPATQACLYRIMLDRTDASGRMLPRGSRICAAVNNMSDRGVTYRMPAPLSNRLAHIEVRPDFDSWVTWAYAAGIANEVISFLRWHNDQLHCFRPNVDTKAFPTPRTWHRVSDILPKLDRKLLLPAVAGLVGFGNATEFKTFIEFERELPNIPAILAGKKQPVPSKSPGTMHLLIGRLLSELPRVKKDELDNILNYIYEFPSHEHALLFLHEALKMPGTVQRKFIDSKGFNEACEKYGYAII